MSLAGLYEDAELAFAAYAYLRFGSTDAQRIELLMDGGGLSPKQAEEFARRFPTVVTQFNDTATSFSATVFADTSGNLTLAIRGTLELSGTPNDLIPTDSHILAHGAGYDQIVALYNWWLRASTPVSELVPQFAVREYVSVPAPGAVELYPVGTSSTGYLVRVADDVATGELVAAIALDANRKVDVVGHSLGGHLAMAFGALFASTTGNISVFNAPGFKDTVANRAFFAALGGTIPSDFNTVNVAANESAIGSVGWNAIARLHSQPGDLVDIPIENQWLSDEPQPRTVSWNHSQEILTDSLAVYALLSKLDPLLDTDTFGAILHAAANGTAGSLEGIVDALRRLLTPEHTPLPVGNSQRDELYKAIFALDDAIPVQMRGEVQVSVGPADLAAAARTDFAAMASLLTLSPFVLTGRTDTGRSQLESRLSNLYPDEYAAWQADQLLTESQRGAKQANYSEQWYADRLAMRNTMGQAYASENAFVKDASLSEVWVYEDKERNALVTREPPGPGVYPTRYVIFGSNEVPSQNLGGGAAGDRLYGGLGADTLIGNGGNDYLEGGAGSDELKGGTGNDTLIGGPGNDTYLVASGEGNDTIIDIDRRGSIVWDGQTLDGGLKLADNIWRSLDGNFTYALGSTSALIISKVGASGRVVIPDFGSPDPASPMLELTLSESLYPTPVPETSLTLWGDFSVPYVNGAPVYNYDSLGNVITSGQPEPFRYDRLYDSPGNDLILSGGGEDTIFAFRGGSDVIITGGDMEPFTLESNLGRYAEADQVEAGGGNDYVDTGYGPDWIDAGSGSDWIVGGPGEDAIFTSHNFVGYPWYGREGWYSYQYFDVWTRSDVTEHFINDTWVYEHSIRGISFLMPWTRLGKVTDIAEPGISEIAFAGEGNDLVVGGAGTDIVLGEAGTDWIQAHGGHDLIDGGSDSDILQGDQPVTDLYFDDFHPGNAYEQGDDTIFGRDGEDLINGGGGQDYLDGGYGDDILEGGEGDDILVGAQGNDQLDGGPGNDEYVFTVGDGTDRITDASGKNLIRFGSTVAPLDVGVTLASGGGLLLTYSAGAQPQSAGNADGFKYRASAAILDSIVLDWRGPIIDPASIPDPLPDFVVSFAGRGDFALRDLIVAATGAGTTTIGTDADETLLDANGDDLVQGGAGNDHIYGLAGANRFEGGAGDDVIVGMLGTNSIDGGSGNDILIGGAGADEIDGGDGEDVLFGATGDDVLRGGDGDDTYVVRRGVGHDELIDSSGAADVVRIADQLTAQDIAVTRNGTHIFLHIAGSSDHLAIQWYRDESNRIEQVRFEDGMIWTAADLEQFAARWLVDTTGTDGNDNLSGSAASETITGLEGNDTIRGGAGDDVIDGGPGDDELNGDDGRDTLIGGPGNDWLGGDWWSGTSSEDLLIGGLGDDTYDVDSLDTVQEAVDEGYDTIETSSAGVLPENVEALRLYGSRQVDIYGNALDNVLEGNNASNLIAGADGNDILRGKDGDDMLDGGAGNDFVDGGPGSDTLMGGAGDDDYLLASGSGRDLLIDDGSAAGGDRVLLSADLTPDNVQVVRDDQDLVLQVVGAADELRIRWFDSANHRVESIEFADGTLWLLEADGTVTIGGAGPSVANPIDAISATEDALFRFVIPPETFSNATNAALSVTQADGSALPAWMSFDPPSRTLFGTPLNEDVGELTLRISALDSKGRSAAEDFLLRVENVNDPPLVTLAPQDQQATENVAFVFTVPGNTFADPDRGDMLTLSANLTDGSPLPAWLHFDPVTRTLAGTPRNEDVGPNAILLIATDNAGARATAEFAINVANVNDAPTVVTPLPDVQVEEGRTSSFIVPDSAFSDQDANDSLTYSASRVDGTALPSWLSFDSTARRFVSAPDEGGIGTLGVSVAATDRAGASATSNFLVTVVPLAGQTLIGTSGNDTLVGTDGRDTIRAGAGNDVVNGGLRNDLLLGEDGDDRLFGEDGSDTLDGGAGADRLDGGPGPDDLIGGTGDDTYVVDLGDSVTEDVGGGIDTVEASMSYALGAEVECLILTGTTPIDGVGNVLPNTLTGNAAANTLDGATGADIMRGGPGDDTYVVDNLGDRVIEYVSEGIDTVRSSLTYTLGTDLENLILTGTAPISGTGNPLNNSLTGNSAANVLSGGAGNDRLDGGPGADSMIGGAGDDTYVVDNASDYISERNGEGTDLVESAISYSLGNNVEHLVLTGANPINGVGNSSNNHLRGNGAANTLAGGSGLDVLQGGDGNDVVSDTGDKNLLDGGSGADMLASGRNADLFVGGTGSDALTLGGGADIIAFNRGDGADVISVPSSKPSGSGEKNDTISLAGVSLADVRLARETNDLLIKVAGSSDAIRFTDWYANANNQTVVRLQSIVDSTSDYNPASTNPLFNRRVVVLNLSALVSAFNSAYSANPALGDWAIPPTSLAAAIVAGSDTQAFGGQLAYRYAHDGNLSQLDFALAAATLGDAGFGLAAQTFPVGPGATDVQAQETGVIGAAAVASQKNVNQALEKDGGVPLRLAADVLWKEQPEIRLLSQRVLDLQSDVLDFTPSLDSSANLTLSIAAPAEESARVTRSYLTAIEWQAMEAALRSHLDRNATVAGGEIVEIQSRHHDGGAAVHLLSGERHLRELHPPSAAV